MKKSKKKQASNKPFMEYVAKHNCCLMSHSSDVVPSSCGGGVQAHGGANNDQIPRKRKGKEKQ